MQLDKDTLRKLRGLIIFTLVILVGLWRFSIVLQAVKTILHILFPFLLGGAIAFVLSVPMNRIRKRLFANAKEKPKKFAAPVSLILTLIFVLALLSLVTIVVVPELGNTIATLGKTLPEKVPVLIRKAEQLVSNHPELVDYIDRGQCNHGIIAVNKANFVGQKQAGILGGIAATLGIVFPSLVIITALAGVINSFSHLAWVQHAFAGIRVCVCVLIFNAVVKLLKGSVKDWPAALIFAAVLAAALLTDLSPVVFVAAAAALGIVIQNFIRRAK